MSDEPTVAAVPAEIAERVSGFCEHSPIGSQWKDCDGCLLASAARLLRQQQELEGSLADLGCSWLMRRSHDTDLTHAARVGCAEQLQEALNAAAPPSDDSTRKDKSSG